MKNLTIEVVTNEYTLRRFVRFPWKVYRGIPQWVPPLIREEIKILSSSNPFFEHAETKLFLAKRGYLTVGRIAAIVDRNFIRAQNVKAGHFGFFEVIPDYETARVLYDRAVEWLKEKGMELVLGPMNPSTNEQCAFLVEGFEYEPNFMMPYNPEYYPLFAEKYGFKKARDLLAYEVDVMEDAPDRWVRIAELVKRKGFTVRPLNLKNFLKESDIIQDIYNAAWRENWGFVPMTREEMLWMGKRLKPLAVPGLTQIVEYKGEPVGFTVNLPNYNKVLKRLNGRLGLLGIFHFFQYSKEITELRCMTLGIKSAYRKKGVDALLCLESWKAARDMGLKKAEFSWILEENIPMRNFLEQIGAKVTKRYRIYEKGIV
jgi:GNAT superfamily N-acetyltransferase